MKNSLHRKERLNNQIYIKHLYHSGHKIYHSGFICLWIIVEENNKNKINIPKNDELNVKTLFSVSKRYHKKAVDRNKVKRLMKESFRLNKKIIYNYVNNKNCLLLLSFMYTKHDIPSFNQTLNSINNILVELTKNLQNE